MTTTAKTTVNFHDEHFLHHEEKHQKKITDTENRIHQHEMTTEDLLQGIKINKFLGEGSFGAAFTCEFSNPHKFGVISYYVIKLPINLITRIPHYKTSLQDKTLGEISRHFFKNDDSLYAMDIMNSAFSIDKQDSIRDFRQEIHNAEAILQPPVYKLRPLLKPRQPPVSTSAHHSDAGTSLKNLTADEYAQLIREMQNIRQQPGHAHWHPVLHVDLTIPCIISAQADGSLNQLVQQMTDTQHREMYFQFGDAGQENLPKIWLTIAYQTGLAIEYMFEYSDKVHCDIKPENILYRFDGMENNKKLHLWISDYGICADNARIPSSIVFQRFPGTPYFTPDIQDHAGWSDIPKPPYVAVTIYQYMMTLITSLVYGDCDSGQVNLLFDEQFPDNRFDIFKSYGHAYNIIHTLGCKNIEHQTVWESFKDLIYFDDPHQILPLFQTFMNYIKTELSPQSYEFIMSEEEYMFYFHGDESTQEHPMLQRLAFADSQDAVVEGMIGKPRNGFITPREFIIPHSIHFFPHPWPRSPFADLRDREVERESPIWCARRMGGIALW